MPDPRGVLAGQVGTDAWTTKNDEKGYCFKLGSEQRCRRLGSEKNGILVEKGSFQHKPVIRGKNANVTIVGQ